MPNANERKDEKYMKKQNHTSHIAPHTSQKGITLIALIITIIVMLILVGVTINVALNGGLFDKAETAKTQTQLAVDREELQMAVIAALNNDREIPNAIAIKNNLQTAWEVTGNDGGPYTCTSPNGNIFTVDNKGNIEPGGNDSGGEGQEPGGNVAGIQIINTYNAMNNTEVLRIIPVLYTEKEAAQMVYTDLTGETDDTIQKKQDLMLKIANANSSTQYESYDDMIDDLKGNISDDISTPEKAFAVIMKYGLNKKYETLEEYAAAITNSENKALKVDGTAVGGVVWEGCIATYEATENKQYQIQIEIDEIVLTETANVTYVCGEGIQYDKVYAYSKNGLSLYFVFKDDGSVTMKMKGTFHDPLITGTYSLNMEEDTYNVDGQPVQFKNRVFSSDIGGVGAMENGKGFTGYFDEDFRTFNYIIAYGSYDAEGNYTNLTWGELKVNPVLKPSDVLN